MKKIILFVSALLSLIPHYANAAVALSISDLNGPALLNPPFTLGWQFVVNRNVSVTGLGFFDDTQDGLAESHEIGLWDVQGNLLASTTIQAGLSGSLIEQFRYNLVAPTILSARQTYFIGALYTSSLDNLVFDSNNLSTDLAITYQNATFSFGPTLANPTVSSTFLGFFGPNFTFNGVPEPASWMLMFLGFGFVGGAIRLRGAKQRVRTILEY